MSSVGSLPGSYLESIFSALQTGGLSSIASTNKATSTSPASYRQQTDSTQLSPLAQLLSTLQQIQQTDPAEYQQVTAQISTNLKSAAQTAQKTGGNSAAANQLNQLATDFSTASQTGQLPNVQDLAQAIGGRGGHHDHQAEAAPADSNTGNSAAPYSSSASLLSQFLASLETNGSDNGSVNPLAIISTTLANASSSGTDSAG